MVGSGRKTLQRSNSLPVAGLAVLLDILGVVDTCGEGRRHDAVAQRSAGRSPRTNVLPSVLYKDLYMMLDYLKGGGMESQSLINFIRELLIFPIWERSLELCFADGMADCAYGQILQFFPAFSNHLFSAFISLLVDFFEGRFQDIRIQINRHLGFVKHETKLEVTLRFRQALFGRTTKPMLAQMNDLLRKDINTLAELLHGVLKSQIHLDQCLFVKV